MAWSSSNLSLPYVTQCMKSALLKATSICSRSSDATKARSDESDLPSCVHCAVIYSPSCGCSSSNCVVMNTMSATVKGDFRRMSFRLWIAFVSSLPACRSFSLWSSPHTKHPRISLIQCELAGWSGTGPSQEPLPFPPNPRRPYCVM